MFSMLSHLDTKKRHRRTTESHNRRDAKAAAELAASGYPPLRTICCELREGVMILSGTVPSYHQKQLAQTVVAKTDGVMRVENRLEVRSKKEMR